MAILIFLLSVCIGTMIFIRYLCNPYHYPYLIITLDVTGKRAVKTESEVESYLLLHGLDVFDRHVKKVDAWKQSCLTKIQASMFCALRRKQFESILDDVCAISFRLVRYQTRYRQHNYVRTSYKICTEYDRFDCSYEYVRGMWMRLGYHGFQITTDKYHNKNQRSLMTKSLRNKIKARDNYTCQICGKYMPDSVGLHIDHIIPVSKGGKSIESNLRVLCSVCNGRKSNK